MDLKGKKAVITGSGRRVGRELARTFAARGARIAIHCRRSLPDAEALFREIGGSAAGHELFRFDLTDPRELEKAAAALFADASILINNASAYLRRTLEKETPADMFAQMDVNCFAPIRLMQYFARYGKRPGAIINLLDQGICRPDQASFSYGLSKKALADATRAAALQLAPEIRVNGLAPGPVLPPADLPGSKMEKTLRTVPLRRPVRMQDLCAGAVFLAENESTTGTVLFIDCGQSLMQQPGP